MRLIDFFDKGVESGPDRICFDDGGRRYTYAEVASASHRIAGVLRHVGLKKGARIATYSPNSAEAFIAVLGVQRAGCVWLPVNVRNLVAENVEFLRENDCELLFFHSRYRAEAETMVQALPALRAVICVDRGAPGYSVLEDWAAEFPADPHDVPMNGHDVAIIKSTGGTTGRPKSVMITHLNMETMIASFLASIPLPEPPVHLLAVPMTHGAGNIAFALMTRGATTIVLDRADPDRILAAIEAHRVTVLFLPPTVIYTLLGRPDIKNRDFSSLRNLIYSAAPMSADKLDEALTVFGPVMTQAYGQTEAPLLCTFMSPADHLVPDPAERRRRLLSCGKPTPFVDLAIMSDDGLLLGRDEVGEIVVRGNLVMKGYANNPTETEAASRFGWHHTGDVGRRDAEGWVYIVDRKKDMIISGGFNIYPSEIEQVLWSHPAVQDCAVIGVPDSKWGEAVKAVIELKPGASGEADEFIGFCKMQLGSMKAPKSVEIWRELPRSSLGKVVKRDIRDRFWAGQDRQV